MADFLPVRLGVIGNRREPLLRQLRTRHCAEQRQAFAHETQNPLTRVIRGIVFAGFAIATEIVHLTDLRLIAQAVALTGAVGRVDLKKAQRCAQCIRQQKTVDRSLNHEGGGHLLEPLGDSDAKAGTGQRVTVQVMQACCAGNL